jgi:hypothetical protein
MEECCLRLSSTPALRNRLWGPWEILRNGRRILNTGSNANDSVGTTCVLAFQGLRSLGNMWLFAFEKGVTIGGVQYMGWCI